MEDTTRIDWSYLEGLTADELNLEMHKLIAKYKVKSKKIGVIRGLLPETTPEWMLLLIAKEIALVWKKPTPKLDVDVELMKASIVTAKLAMNNVMNKL